MVKEIFDIVVALDFRAKRPQYVVYAVGKDDWHVMDWAGCNHRRIKIPGQPKFTTYKEARFWADVWKSKPTHEVAGVGRFTSRYIPGAGTFLSPNDDSWWQLCVVTKEIMQEDFDILKREYREARK